jgi:hypothetical protein
MPRTLPISPAWVHRTRTRLWIGMLGSADADWKAKIFVRIQYIDEAS